MRKTQMALAAVALVASSAALADVAVSGRIDYGYQSGNSASFNRQLGGGLLAPNFLNFTGSEDLGGGMKAVFNASAALPGAQGNMTFLKQYVGLAGDFGSINLGQQVDAFGGGILGFDVTGGGNMGSAVTALFMHGSSGVFHDNTIGYTSPSIGGFTAAASYTANNGKGAGPVTAIKQGDYALFASGDLGMFKVGAGYSLVNTNKTAAVAVGSDFGFAKVNVLYMDSNRAAGVAGATATTTGVNGSVPLVGALTATAGYYSTDGSAINGSNTSIGLLYSLSKQTTVFGNFEKATGKTILQRGGGNFGTAGEIATVGVAHSF